MAECWNLQFVDDQWLLSFGDIIYGQTTEFSCKGPNTFELMVNPEDCDVPDILVIEGGDLSNCHCSSSSSISSSSSGSSDSSSSESSGSSGSESSSSSCVGSSTTCCACVPLSLCATVTSTCPCWGTQVVVLTFDDYIWRGSEASLCPSYYNIALQCIGGEWRLSLDVYQDGGYANICFTTAGHPQVAVSADCDPLPFHVTFDMQVSEMFLALNCGCSSSDVITFDIVEGECS